MNSIPGDLYTRIQAALLRCPAFDRDRDLRALFVDERLASWYDALPEADTRAARVRAVIDRLSQAINSAGDNALELLLRVLGENTPPGDALRDELAALARETAQALADNLSTTIAELEAASGLSAASMAQVLPLLRAQLDAVKTRIAFQQQQQVQTQTNVAGDYHDHRQYFYGPPPETACPNLDEALTCYLSYVIEQNSRLQLQGIRSASGLVSIELEEVYITLTATVRKTVTDEEAWVEEMARLAPGETKRLPPARGGIEGGSVQQVKVQV